MATTHYVILVHGTWSAPNGSSLKWHETDESDAHRFSTCLNAALDQAGLGHPVGRVLEGKPIEFLWSGSNKHSDRVKAGAKLADLVQKIETSDPSACIHFVAHSHGGNIVLVAIEQYLRRLRAKAERAFNDIITHEEVTRNDALEYINKTLMPRMVDEKAIDCLINGTRARNNATETNKYLRLFSEIVINSTSTNRIGKLIFLGTPFLWKYWIRRNYYLSVIEFVNSIVYAFLATPIVFCMAYIILICSWTTAYIINILSKAINASSHLVSASINLSTWINNSNVFVGVFLTVAIVVIQYVALFGVLPMPMNAIIGIVSFIIGTVLINSLFNVPVPIFNPLNWPGLTVYYSIWSIFGALCLAVWFMREVSKNDTNIYFENKFDFKIRADSAIPYKSLVIHSGFLDEALLALSSEPLVYGVLLPQVHNLLTPEFRFTLGRRPAGQDSSFGYYVVNVVTLLFKLVPLAAMTLASPFRWFLERWLTAQLLSVISSPALGISARELLGAVIVPRAEIGIPSVFQETSWDVSAELLQFPPAQVSTKESPSNRYSFLWEPEDLERRSESSWIWTQLQASVGDIERQYLGLFENDYWHLRERLAKISLVLEERMRELIGATGLMHSAYYTNPKIIRAISKFIIAGIFVPWSEETNFHIASSVKGAPRRR